MNALLRRLGVVLATGMMLVGLLVTPAGAAGNRVCHSDPNIHAISIQVRYSGEYWTFLHQGDCTTAGRTVVRMRTRAAVRGLFHWYGEQTWRTMAVEPCTICTQLDGRSASVQRVYVP